MGTKSAGQYRARREDGVCTNCARRVRTGKALCARCGDAQRRSARRRYAANRAARAAQQQAYTAARAADGWCTICGRKRTGADLQHRRCADCRLRAAATERAARAAGKRKPPVRRPPTPEQRAARKAYAAALYRMRKLVGHCVRCGGGPVVVGYAQCATCRTRAGRAPAGGVAARKTG